MKLKTLKNIINNLTDWNNPRFFIENTTPNKVEEEVREEAIKWVKEDIEERYNLTIDVLIEKWIKRLNITEEDLK